MKRESGNWKLNTGGARSGVALVVTLTVMALLLIMAVAFMTNMRSERQVSFNYRRQVQARQAALAGLNVAVAKMNRFYTDAEAVSGSIATMAGRFYYTNGNSSASVTIPGVTSYTAYSTNNTLMFSWVKGPVYTPGTTNWAEKVNINGGNFKWPPNAQQSGIYLPIANTCVNPARATGTGWGPEKPAIWTAYMQSNGNRSGCKFAFWVDDESSKINLSNAARRDLGTMGTNNAHFFSDSPSGVGYYPSGTPPPYAMIAQSPNRQISSVDISALDVGVVTKGAAGSGYAPDGPNWADAGTLNSLETARNSGSWQPLQSPEEVLSLDNRLTMSDYQAVKPCLTTWSVENEDRSALFKSNNVAAARYNLGRAITNPTVAADLYKYLMTTCDLKNSTSAKRFFNNTPTFGNKYTGFTNGSVEQIVANIISYVSDPRTVAPQGSQPPKLVSDAVGNWNPTTTVLPGGDGRGPCGLWKAAYMNEIAVSLCWQPIQPPAPAAKRWQLWAALCIEFVNPYEIALPSATLSQRYELFLDSAVAVTCNLQAPATPSSLTQNWSTNNIAMTPPAVVIPAHSYSSIDAPGSSGVYYFQWTVGGQVITNVAPTVTGIRINLPQIRQTMDHMGTANKGIIDWFKATNMVLAAVQPSQSAVVGALVGNPPPAPADFWGTGNRARWSVAKNDPRVHVWYGPPYTGNMVTMRGYPGTYTGQNPTVAPSSGPAPPITSGIGPVDFRGGDVENYHNLYAPKVNFVEFRSNFWIAEGGMRSLGELGFIHTGRPWRSLSLQYYGAQTDEQVSGHEIMGKGNRSIPDWAMLDLFAVNSPPIHGRVNINNGGWHLGNTGWGAYVRDFPRAATFEDAQTFPTHPNLLAVWSSAATSFLLSPNYYWSYITLRTSAYNAYPINPVVQTTALNVTDAASVPLAAALNVIPDYRFRNKLANYISYCYRPLNQNRSNFAPQGDPSDTLFVPTKDIWNPYYTVGQICELPCMNYLFSGTGNQVAYTDADKEDTLRRIINVLTTRGDAFTIHAIGNADGGEARLMALIERTREPLVTPAIDRNKFRVRQVRWFTD